MPEANQPDAGPALELKALIHRKAQLEIAIARIDTIARIAVLAAEDPAARTAALLDVLAICDGLEPASTEGA